MMKETCIDILRVVLLIINSKVLNDVCFFTDYGYKQCISSDITYRFNINEQTYITETVPDEQ